MRWQLLMIATCVILIVLSVISKCGTSLYRSLQPSPSPNFKQFHSAKLGLSSHSNRSNSESEDISTDNTVRNFPLHSDKSLPDLLSTSPPFKGRTKTEKERPRSCVEGGLPKPYFKLGEDVNNIMKKRWSSIGLNSKLYQAFDKLAKEEEEYTDSLENPEKSDDTNSSDRIPPLKEDYEPESLDSNFSDEKPLNGRRFKKLQQKWELLSGQNSSESPPPSPTNLAKSKIPRPITSPVRPSGIPIPVKKVTTPPSGKNPIVKGTNSIRNSPMKKTTSSVRWDIYIMCSSLFLYVAFAVVITMIRHKKILLFLLHVSTGLTFTFSHLQDAFYCLTLTQLKSLHFLLSLVFF